MDSQGIIRDDNYCVYRHTFRRSVYINRSSFYLRLTMNERCDKMEESLVKRNVFDMRPRIFVSSTFYDMKYIREDLTRFISMMNYEPILSETGSIGYTPYKKLDISCYEAMHNSDMAVLIIGGRYGSPASDEKTKNELSEYISVTRQEFRTARDEHIPVYVFIDEKVFTEYELYLSNSDREIVNDINYNYIDNINIFRFISEIRSLGLPEFHFSTIKDIENALADQWAGLMKDHLKLLREQAAVEKVSETLDRFEDVISNLDDKLSLLGDRLYQNNHDLYESKLTALKISNCIKKNLKLIVRADEERELVINNLIKAIIDTFNTYSHLKDQSFRNMSDVLSNCLDKYNMKFSSLNFDLRKEKQLYPMLKNNKLLYSEVVKQLLDNYDSIVRAV